MPIADILQKPVDYRYGNHVGHTLGDVAAVTLKSDPNHFAVLHYRAAAVARIDLRADLDCQMLVNRRMSVELEVNSRHDSSCNRHSFATDWIPISRDGRFQRRNSAKF